MGGMVIGNGLSEIGILGYFVLVDLDVKLVW